MAVEALVQHLLGFADVLFPTADDHIDWVRGLACSQQMKLDHFTSRVTRPQKPGGLGRSCHLGPYAVGVLWLRDFRADQKVPQILLLSKCDSVFPRWPAEGSRYLSSGGLARCSEDEGDWGGMLTTVAPSLRLVFLRVSAWEQETNSNLALSTASLVADTG